MRPLISLLFPIVFCMAGCAHAQSGAGPGVAAAPALSTRDAELSLPLENPGFETGMTDGKLPGWRMSQHTGAESYSMTIDTGHAAQGRQSFRMERTREQIYGLIEQLVAVPEGLSGKPVTYSAMLKTDGVGAEGWRLVVTFHGATGVIIDQKRSLPMSGTHDWSRVAVQTPLPAGTRTIAAGVLLLDKGTGWIDDNRLSVASPAAPDDSVAVVEYRHAGFEHYFMTAFPEEIKALDAGQFPGWARTGESFLANAARGNDLAEVCRFFSASFGPRSTHLYTLDAAECAAMKESPRWKFEAAVFHVQLPPVDGGCASGKKKLYRLYNQGMGGTPNHRYTTNRAIRDQMISQGWLPEGHDSEGVIACTL